MKLCSSRREVRSGWSSGYWLRSKAERRRVRCSRTRPPLPILPRSIGFRMVNSPNSSSLYSICGEKFAVWGVGHAGEAELDVLLDICERGGSAAAGRGAAGRRRYRRRKSPAWGCATASREWRSPAVPPSPRRRRCGCFRRKPWPRFPENPRDPGSACWRRGSGSSAWQAFADGGVHIARRPGRYHAGRDSL